MQIDEKLLKHVAESARLNLSDEEVKRFLPQLKEVLEHFKKIKEFDTSNVKPSFHPIEMSDALRDDLVESSLSQEEALRNSVNKDGYFKGPGAM
ncbi:MAG: Asp-tRNA(Asn)/Glu-tRNA(Gln) amidotransferase subunit GatC [Nanoarchaeota archaeon]